MHYRNGEPCPCRNVVSDYVSPRDYAADHPNKEPNFNDQIAAAIQKSNTEHVSAV